MENVETWYGKIRKVGTSLMVIVPNNIVVGAGFNEGDMLKIMAVKNESTTELHD